MAAGPRFAQYSAIIQAARSGLGIGLCRASWWRTNWLAVTCTACGASVVVDQGHYLCVRPDRLDLPAFGVFREWLLEQGAVAGSHGIVGASLITTPGGAVPVLPGNRLAIDRQIRYFA